MIVSYLYAFLAAVFWGAGFIGSRFGLESLPPMWVTFLRFLIAFIATIPFVFRIKNFKSNGQLLPTQLVVGSFVCAVILASMIFLQIKGLALTTVAKSSFITILYAFFTPLLCKLIYGNRLSNFYWLLLSCALVGMGLICDLNFNSFNEGDLITFVCAFFSALHIMAVSHFIKPTYNVMVFNILQMFFVCLVTLPIAIVMEGTAVMMDGHVFTDISSLAGLAFMGIFSTSIAFYLQLKAQEKLPPTTASLIFLMESPFAAVFGYIAFHEVLSKVAIIGAVVVTFSVCLIPFEAKIRRILRRNKFLPHKLAHLLSQLLS